MLSIDDDADWVKWDVGRQRMMREQEEEADRVIQRTNSC